MYTNVCKVWDGYAKINNTSVHSRTHRRTRVGLRTHWCESHCKITIKQYKINPRNTSHYRLPKFSTHYLMISLDGGNQGNTPCDVIERQTFA